MNTGYRHLSFLVLTAALIAPAAITTNAVAQYDRRQEDNHHRHTRVYDRAHRDYRNWDG